MATVRNYVELPTRNGKCFLYSFNELSDIGEHVALIFNHAHLQNAPLVRIHSECLTGDLFGSNLCDCGDQLNEAIQRLVKEGGILLYLRQEGRGIGLYNKIDAYVLQKQGHDTFEANQMLSFPDDARTFKVAAEMLQALNIKNIILLSNNPQKQKQLSAHGINIVERYSTGFYLKRENKNYLMDKIRKAGHLYSSSNLIDIIGVSS